MPLQVPEHRGQDPRGWTASARQARRQQEQEHSGPLCTASAHHHPGPRPQPQPSGGRSRGEADLSLQPNQLHGAESTDSTPPPPPSKDSPPLGREARRQQGEACRRAPPPSRHQGRPAHRKEAPFSVERDPPPPCTGCRAKSCVEAHQPLGGRGSLQHTHASTLRGSLPEAPALGSQAPTP